MRRGWNLYILLFGGSLLLAGCFPEQSASDKADTASTQPDLTVTAVQDGFPVFADPNLESARTIWMNTCRNCHERGVADAPIVTDGNAWQPRIAKGKPTLYQHAINGFFGEDDSMMPARGGNDALSDDEVKLAVDYMVAVATLAINELDEASASPGSSTSHTSEKE